jgi:hypothetical protein
MTVHPTPALRVDPRAMPDLSRSARGQSTAEYALVLVVAATIATLALSWAASTNRVASLFDLVFRSVSGMLA